LIPIAENCDESSFLLLQVLLLRRSRLVQSFLAVERRQEPEAYAELEEKYTAVTQYASRISDELLLVHPDKLETILPSEWFEQHRRATELMSHLHLAIRSPQMRQLLRERLRTLEHFVVPSTSRLFEHDAACLSEIIGFCEALRTLSFEAAHIPVCWSAAQCLTLRELSIHKHAHPIDLALLATAVTQCTALTSLELSHVRTVVPEHGDLGALLAALPASLESLMVSRLVAPAVVPEQVPPPASATDAEPPVLQVSEQTLRQLGVREALLHLRLDGYPSITDAHWEVLATCCPNLRVLNIDHAAVSVEGIRSGLARFPHISGVSVVECVALPLEAFVWSEQIPSLAMIVASCT